MSVASKLYWAAKATLHYRTRVPGRKHRIINQLVNLSCHAITAPQQLENTEVGRRYFVQGWRNNLCKVSLVFYQISICICNYLLYFKLLFDQLQVYYLAQHSQDIKIQFG